MRLTRQRRAVSRRTRAADGRTPATTRRCPTSRFPGKSSKAARIFARRTIAAATGRLRATRSQSTRPRATSGSDASGEEPLTHHNKESNAMSDCILVNTPPNIRESLRKTLSGLHARSCAALIGAATLLSLSASGSACAQAQPPAQQRPHIILNMSDDTGYGDLGPYGGGIGRGMPTPNIDRMAAEGMTFFSFYAQPSCTPGRAAMQTGRIPNRSGMTTVAFQGQGGGLPHAEWTLASVLKMAGYGTYFTGKWHLGEADYALPNAQGYDEMRYAGLYHLNAYTYGDPTWFPDMDPKLREMFARVTKGALSGNAGGPVTEDFKINGQYVDTPVIDGKEGVVGIPYFDGYVEKAALQFLDEAAKTPDTPFFINVNFMKVHQPNMPAPEFQLKSPAKSKYA